MTVVYRQIAVPKKEIGFLKAPASWLLAVTLAVSAVQAAESPGSPPKAKATKAERTEQADHSGTAEWATVPKPAPANRKELGPAFSKAAPSSLADLKSMEKRVKDLVRRLSPSVVDVQVGNGSGSGVVITEDGLVLTAGHVCGKTGREVRLTFPDQFHVSRLAADDQRPGVAGIGVGDLARDEVEADIEGGRKDR